MTKVVWKDGSSCSHIVEDVFEHLAVPARKVSEYRKNFWFNFLAFETKHLTFIFFYLSIK